MEGSVSEFVVAVVGNLARAISSAKPKIVDIRYRVLKLTGRRLLQLWYTRDYGVSDAGECSFGLINEQKSVVKE